MTAIRRLLKDLEADIAVPPVRLWRPFWLQPQDMCMPPACVPVVVRGVYCRRRCCCGFMPLSCCRLLQDRVDAAEREMEEIDTKLASMSSIVDEVTRVRGYAQY